MKRIYSLLFIWMIALSAWAQSGVDYDPENPADPAVYYTLTMEATPRSGGTVNKSRVSMEAGQTIYCYANAKTGYAFKQWMIGDSLVSTQSSFKLTMPAHNVALVAFFEYVGYNPANPGDPFVDGYRHNVRVYATPSVGGYFNSSSFTLTEGEITRIYAYPRNGYRFEFWMQGNTVVSTDNPLTIKMGTQDVEYKAVFTYNPENPADPFTNHFDSETGEVVIDDFTSGSLNSAISKAIGAWENADAVKSITVKGVLNSYDFGFAGRYVNCEKIDLSRTTGYVEIPSYSFEDASALKRIYLPTNVENIGKCAFMGCSNLQEMYLYSPIPPVLGNDVFKDVPAGQFVVYVPSSAVQLYNKADGWQDLVIRSLDSEEKSFTINFPAGSDMSKYANMVLELVNVQSGQVYKYLVTGRQSYTFYALMKNTVYNISLKNSMGEVLAKLSNVMLGEEDVTVSFDSIKKMVDVTIRVQTPDGADVTSKVDIIWYDGQDTYLCQGNVLKGIVEGCVLKCNINISGDLALEYVQPAPFECTATESAVVYKLSGIEKVGISGYVIDRNTRRRISGALVSLSQTMNKRNNKTFSVKTDNSGYFNVVAYNVPTKFVFSAYDYVSESQVINELSVVDGKVEIGNVELASIVGATINLSHTYTTSVEMGMTPDFQTWYDDYENITYDVYNVSLDKRIAQVSYRYPQLVLLDDAQIGDSIAITAISKRGKFMPVTVGAVIDSTNVIDAEFDIKQLGQIKVDYKKSENKSVVAILYDANGYLCKKYKYSNGELKIEELKDGTYYLVMMGECEKYNSLYNLSRYLSMGLTEGVDYVKEEFTVESGVVATATYDEIPFFDENKFNYIEMGNSSLYSSQSSITVGNYVTLVGSLDVIADLAELDDLKMIVDLPTATEFVEGSVMVGDNVISGYGFEANTLTIPLDGYKKGDKIKFCVIPTEAGNYSPNALVSFNANERQSILPIGNTHYSVSAMTINVPSVTASKTVSVSGVVAEPESVVEIYDNDVIVGSVKPLANGDWETECELDGAYNLSTHNIYAKVITKSGVEYESETKSCGYDINAIFVKDVTMYYNGYKNVFDFVNPGQKSQSYSYSSNTAFTFTLNFNNNDTAKISNVVLYVKTMENEWVPLFPQYDVNKRCWVASAKSSDLNDSYPVNVSVDFIAKNDLLVDRESINEEWDNLYSVLNEFSIEKRDSIVNYFKSEVEVENYLLDKLDMLLEQEDIDVDAIVGLLDSLLVVDDGLFDDTLSHEDFMEFLQSRNESIESWLQQSEVDFEQLLDDIYLDEEFDLSEDFSFVTTTSSGHKQCSKKTVTLEEFSTLLSNGFRKIPLTDGSDIYCRFTAEGVEYIDVRNLCLYSIETKEGILASKSYALNSTKSRECLSNALELIKSLPELWNSNYCTSEDLSRLLISIDYIILQLNCFYENVLAERTQSITKYYDDIIAAYKTQIKENAVLKKIIQARLDAYNLECNHLRLKRNSLIENKEAVVKDMTLSSLDKQKQIEAIDKELDDVVDKLYDIINKKIKDVKKDFRKADRCTAKIQKRINELEKFKDIALGALKKFPPRLFKGIKMPTVLRVSGKLAGDCGILLQVACLCLDFMEVYDDITNWVSLMNVIDIKIPCPANPERAKSLQSEIYSSATRYTSFHIGTLVGAGAAILIPSTTPITWGVELAVSAVVEWAKFLDFRNSLNERTIFWQDVARLQCKKEDVPPKNTDAGEHTPKTPDSRPAIDPAGYVYEGVSSNRIEGVMASCYYKEAQVDEYGVVQEKAILWDAEEYAQENPLFTDENGMYQWYVPKGLWQVKFEKEGYETAYSEWLPVPPPQLEVNIAMVQNKQPEVKSVHAYEEGIEIEFDKYMQPASLNEDNIFVVKDGNKLPGAVTMLNEEVAYKDKNDTYASKVRFVLDQPVAGGEITLTVSNRVRNYAGAHMQDNYTQTFDIEKEIKGVVVDSVVSVSYEGECLLNVKAVPAEAAAGKVLAVCSLSEIIVSVETDSVVLDKNGEAVIKLFGELPGSGAVKCSVVGYDCEATTTVNVEYEIIGVTANPVASISTGSTVDKGMAVTLSCETEGAVIYYTLDGTCPCDASALLYDGSPIIINEDTELRVMAVADGLYESDIVVYHYYVSVLKATATPVASVPSGCTVDKGTAVTLSCETEGAVIYYTLDGTSPSVDAALLYDGSPIIINDDTELRIMAVAPGCYDSEVVVYNYYIPVPGITSKPVASVPSGSTVKMGTAVTLSCSTTGASIYYTLDGTSPSVDAALLYDGSPIIINEDTELRIMAVADGLYESEVVVYNYSISVTAKPVASIPSGSTVKMGTAVTLSCPTADASIYYTLDGTSPSVDAALLYDGSPIIINEDTEIHIMAVASGCYESEVVVYNYSIPVTATPVTSRPSGSTVEKGTAVTLSCETAGASIYYTLDGTSPSVGAALLYDGSPIIINEDIELRIMAVAPGCYDSEVVVLHFYVEFLEVTIHKKWDDVLICDNTSNKFVAYQWYKDELPIVGETKQFYSEAGGLNGRYYVMAQVSAGGWIQSNVITCGVASLLNVSPKMFKRSEACVVSVDATGNVCLDVFDASGRLVKRVDMLGRTVKLQLEKSGLYVIKATGLKENLEPVKIIVVE